METQIAIGAIRTTHGVKGYLKVKSFSGEFDHFYDLKAITLEKQGQKKVFEIEKISPLGGEIILKLKGIDNPEKGKLYAGWTIWVPKEFAAPLNEGEFYHADLYGCSLVLKGEVIGSVKSIFDSGANDLIEVVRGDGKTSLVPFSPQFIGKVDIDKKEIELLEGWILD